MSRIKGRYVAQIVLTIDEERKDYMLPLEQIKKNFAGLTEGIKNHLEHGEFTTVEVIEQYSDVYEVEDGERKNDVPTNIIESLKEEINTVNRLNDRIKNRGNNG